MSADGMTFLINEATVTAIRNALIEHDELSALILFRQAFPGVVDPEEQRRCVRMIAAWRPLPEVS